MLVKPLRLAIGWLPGVKQSIRGKALYRVLDLKPKTPCFFFIQKLKQVECEKVIVSSNLSLPFMGRLALGPNLFPVTYLFFILEYPSG